METETAVKGVRGEEMEEEEERYIWKKVNVGRREAVGMEEGSES